MWGAPNSVSGNPAFVMYCRQPGTRIAEIMELIDHGFDDATIAAMYDNGTGNVCQAADIAVYRKAHDGHLSRGSRSEDPRRGELYVLVAIKHMRIRHAAELLHLDRTTAYKWSKNYRPR